MESRNGEEKSLFTENRKENPVGNSAPNWSNLALLYVSCELLSVNF